MNALPSFFDSAKTLLKHVVLHGVCTLSSFQVLVRGLRAVVTITAPYHQRPVTLIRFIQLGFGRPVQSHRAMFEQARILCGVVIHDPLLY